MVYFLKAKSEVKFYLESYIKQVENQLNKRMKTIRADNGKEYVNSDIKKYLGVQE